MPSYRSNHAHPYPHSLLAHAHILTTHIYLITHILPTTRPAHRNQIREERTRSQSQTRPDPTHKPIPSPEENTQPCHRNKTRQAKPTIDRSRREKSTTHAGPDMLTTLPNEFNETFGSPRYFVPQSLPRNSMKQPGRANLEARDERAEDIF